MSCMSLREIMKQENKLNINKTGFLVNKNLWQKYIIPIAQK